VKTSVAFEEKPITLQPQDGSSALLQKIQNNKDGLIVGYTSAFIASGKRKSFEIHHGS